MRLRPPAPLPLALVLALAAGNCGSSGGGNPAPIPMDGYTQAIINRDCARFVACGQMPDMATCLASSSIDLGQLFAEVSAGKTTYDGAAAAKCLAAASLVGVACTMTAQQAVPTDPSCAHIFNGTLPAGATCSAANECVSANCNITGCSGTPVCCAGTCTPPAPVPIGGGCSAAAGLNCVAGAYCRTSPAVCTADIAAGQPCDVSMADVCVFGLSCVPTASGTQLICSALPAEGATCFTGYPCDAIGDFCDPTTLKCVPKIAVGGACPSDLGCVDYAQCDVTTMVCVAGGKAGASCAPGEPACLGSLECTTDAVCALPAPGPVCP